MTTTHAGGCNCDALRYEISGEPLFVHACHCRDCQTRTGSAFGLTMMLEETQFDLVSGTPATVRYFGDSGGGKTSHFCDKCAVHIWNFSDSRPQIIGLRPGTLDDSDWFTVGAHVWTIRKQPWLHLDPKIPSFDKMYDLKATWPEAAVARLAGLTG